MHTYAAYLLFSKDLIIFISKLVSQWHSLHAQRKQISSLLFCLFWSSILQRGQIIAILFKKHYFKKCIAATSVTNVRKIDERPDFVELTQVLRIYHLAFTLLIADRACIADLYWSEAESKRWHMESISRGIRVMRCMGSSKKVFIGRRWQMSFRSMSFRALTNSTRFLKIQNKSY